MEATVSYLNTAAESWWPHVFHGAWQAALVALTALVVVGLFRRRLPATLCYGLLFLAVMKFVVPPMAALPTGAFSWGPAATSETPGEATLLAPVTGGFTGAYEPVPAPPVAHPVPARPRVPAPMAASSASATITSASAVPEPAVAKTPLRPTWLGLLFALHLAGMAAMALWIAGSTLGLYRQVRRVRAVRSGAAHEALQTLRAQLGIKREIRLLIGEDDRPPIAFGLFRPAVLLPAALADQLDTPEARAILAHELAHHRRRDPWAIALENLALLVWWFHPVLWRLIHRSRRTREECCDDVVLSLGVSDGATYCEGLLRTAVAVSGPKRFAMPLGHANALHPLGPRMKRIMDTTLHRRPKLSLAGLLTVVVLGLVVLPGLRVADARSGSGSAATEALPAAQPAKPPVFRPLATAGKVIFSGAYQHFSRGGAYPDPGDVEIREDEDGTLTVTGLFRDTGYQAKSGPGLSTGEYATGQLFLDGTAKYSIHLQMEDGTAFLTRRGIREDVDDKPLSVPKGAVFDPNTRPDPYLVAQIMMRRLNLKEGEEKTLQVYDWDNAGEGMAVYEIAYRHQGRETVTVPAGTFAANHIVLEQRTSANTWFKKRAGHLTDFWVLDNGVIVRILRHREPYELRLSRCSIPTLETATPPVSEAVPDTPITPVDFPKASPTCTVDFTAEEDRKGMVKWTDMPVMVEEGDILYIQASGSMGFFAGSPDNVMGGPNGQGMHPLYQKYFLFSDRAFMALVGLIGLDPIVSDDERTGMYGPGFIGAGIKATKRTPGAARLRLGVNDSTGRNPGSYQVRIWLVRNGAVLSRDEAAAARPRKPDPDAPALEILEARYGRGTRWTDATAALKRRAADGRLVLNVTDTLGQNPWPNVNDSLHVRYRVQGVEQTIIVQEGETLRIGAGEKSAPTVYVDVSKPLHALPFTEDFNDGNFTANPAWKEYNLGSHLGTVEVVDGTLRIVRRSDVVRRVNGSDGGTGITLEADLPVTDATEVVFDGKVVFRDIPGGSGLSGRNHPVSVQVIVDDVEGKEVIVRYGLNYGNAVRRVDTTAYKQAGLAVLQNEWTRNVRFRIRALCPKAVRVTNLGILAYGWDYEGYVDNLRIIDTPASLEILAARYGAGGKWVDVTKELRQCVRNGALTVSVSNDLAGDPVANVEKQLEVRYRFAGETGEISAREGEMLRIPADAGKSAAPQAAPAKAAEYHPLPTAGKVIFNGQYKHFSRGRAYPDPGDIEVRESEDGTLTVSGSFRGGGNQAKSGPGLSIGEYVSGQLLRDGTTKYEMRLRMRDGKVLLTRRGVREDVDDKALPVPEGAVFDPNSRPDPYLVAQIMMRRLNLKEGEEKTLQVYDWDNTGEGMAAYKIVYRHMGKETVTVPAGTFEANHIVLEQRTSANTWFKKRAGHLTDFWALDNSVIVRILRHREPYELRLLRCSIPTLETVEPPVSEAVPDTPVTAWRVAQDCSRVRSR